MMAETKTKPTGQSVEHFISKVESEQVRDDCTTLINIMKKVTGCEAKMWGPSIIGFDQYHYKYESGHEGDICLTGFSPRKGNISLYVIGPGDYSKFLEKLGKHKATKGCLYIKKLDDVNMDALEALIEKSVKDTRKKYPDKKK